MMHVNAQVLQTFLCFIIFAGFANADFGKHGYDQCKKKIETNLNCVIIQNNEQIPFPDYDIIYKTSSSPSYAIKLNLCRIVANTCKGKTSMAVMYPLDATNIESDCHRLQTFQVQTNVTNENLMTMQYLSSEVCHQGTLSPVEGTETETLLYKLNIDLHCDRKAEIPLILTNSGETNSSICSPKVMIYSKYGCRQTKIEKINNFFSENYWMFGIIFIIFGIYNTFFGGRMFKATIVLFGIVSTVGLVFFCLYFIFEVNNKMPEWLSWVAFLNSCCVGAVIGYFMTKIIKIGVCIIGCWTGVIFAILLDSLIFNLFNSAIILYILIVIFVMICGFLAYRYYEYVLIFSTAILGSYFFIRGISLLAGGFPSEMDLLEQIKNGTLVEIPWTFYLYFAFIFLLSIIGIFIQVSRPAKVSKKEKKELQELKDTDDSQNSKKKKKNKRKLKIKKKEEPQAVPGEKVEDIESSPEKKEYNEMEEDDEATEEVDNE